MSKIQLHKAKIRGLNVQGHGTTHVAMALPFYRSNFGQYVHRVRSGLNHWRDGDIHHISLSMWCGSHGFIGGDSPKGTLFANAPDGALFCAICEGKAIGAGMDGAAIINGREVKFSPRK